MKVVEVNGKSVHYHDRGAGVPLVLLHGFPLDARIMLEVASRLEGDARTIVPDLPGFGQSSYVGPLTMDSLADDVHELLHRVGALPCVLGGLSMGGYVSLAFAARHADALRGLILIDTRADPDGDEQRRNRERFAALAGEQGVQPIIDAMLPRMFAERTRRDRPEIVQRVTAMMSACPPATAAAASLAMRDRADHTGTLQRLAAPLLLVYGRHDLSTPPSVGEALAQAARHATLRVIDDAGHLSPIEQPAAVADAIRAFLATL